MKKIFNFRPIFLAFIGVFIGAYFSTQIFFGSLFLKIFVIALIVLCFAFAFTKIKFFNSRKIAIIVLIFSLIFGFSSSIVTVLNHNNKQIDANIEVTGTVTDKIVDYDGYSTIILRDISSPDEKINGKLKLTVFSGVSGEIECGNILSFKANVKSYQILKDDFSVNSYSSKTNCKYYASANLDDIEIGQGKASFFEKIRISSRNQILKATSNDEIGNLIYSVIFGDKTYLSQSTQTLFRQSGTAHLLAVSGLHVGFIVALLLLIFKLLKLKRPLKVILIAIFLAVYNLLCGFSASIVRASLMIILLLLSQLFGQKNDGLTALGIAGLCILIFKPLMAFDLGFQLSFSSVLGILCLAKPLENYFKRIKIPSVIASAFAVCVSSTIGTLPFIGIAFGEFVYVGLVSNLLLIPLFGFVYCFTFAIFLLGMIFSFCFKIMFLAEVGFGLILKLCKVFSIVATFNISKIAFLMLSMYPVIMLVGKHSLLGTKEKSLIAKVGICILCVCLGLSFISPKIKSFSATKLESDALILASSANEIIIVSEKFDEKEINEAMDYITQENFDNLLVGVVITGEAKDVKQVYDFAKENENVSIFLTLNSFLDEREIVKFDNIKILTDNYNFASFNFSVYYESGYVCGVLIGCETKTVLAINSLSTAQVNSLNEQITKVDVIACNKFKQCYNKFKINFKHFLASTSEFDLQLDVSLTNKAHRLRVC